LYHREKSEQKSGHYFSTRAAFQVGRLAGFRKLQEDADGGAALSCVGRETAWKKKFPPRSRNDCAGFANAALFIALRIRGSGPLNALEIVSADPVVFQTAISPALVPGPLNLRGKIKSTAESEETPPPATYGNSR